MALPEPDVEVTWDPAGRAQGVTLLRRTVQGFFTRRIEPAGLVSQMEASWILGMSRMWVNRLVHDGAIKDTKWRDQRSGSARIVSRISLPELKRYMRANGIPLENRRLFLQADR